MLKTVPTKNQNLKFMLKAETSTNIFILKNNYTLYPKFYLILDDRTLIDFYFFPLILFVLCIFYCKGIFLFLQKNVNGIHTAQ